MIGQFQCEGRPSTFDAVYQNVPAVVVGDVPGNRKSEACPSGFARSRSVDTIETLEDPIELLCGNSHSAISDIDEHITIGSADGDFD